MKIRTYHYRWAFLTDRTISLVNRTTIEKRGAFNVGLGYYNGSVLPRGGKTIVEIHKNGKVYTGEEYCSDDDNFCKKTGKENALAKAMLQLEKDESNG